MTIAPAMGRFSTAFPSHAASFILVASVPGFPAESAYSEGIVPSPFATTSLLALTFDHSYVGSPSKLLSILPPSRYSTVFLASHKSSFVHTQRPVARSPSGYVDRASHAGSVLGRTSRFWNWPEAAYTHLGASHNYS